MEKIQLTWVAVGLILAAVAVATFVFVGHPWNGPEIGVVLDRGAKPIAGGSGIFPDAECGIVNCHGLEIMCGSGAPEICTMEYQVGDNCRKYAKCGIIDGQCQQTPNPEFAECASCVSKCSADFKNDQASLFECDGKCSQIEISKGTNSAEISHRRSIIESLYPKFKDFESQASFAGTRVKAVIDGNDYYFAYITLGSGVPVVAATCFKVDSEYKLYYIGDLTDSSIAGDENYNDVDPVECEGVKITLSSVVNSDNEAVCADCGQGGWEKMDYNCSGTINNKESFKKCLENFDWFKGQADVDITKISEGYIEIGSMETLESPAANTIKVMIYRQWAVDGVGNLYLLGQLG